VGEGDGRCAVGTDSPDPKRRAMAGDCSERQGLDGVLEFLDECKAGDLRSGSFLSDEVYVL